MSSKLVLAFAALFLSASAAPGQSAGKAAGDAQEVCVSHDLVSGSIVAAGNRATDPLMAAWLQRFRQCNPGVKTELRHDTHMSTDAFDAAIASTDIDLIPAARELVPSEMERLTRKFGGPPLIVAVATGSFASKSTTHALAFYVNSANPLTRISLDQIRQIYGPAGTITKWGQLGLTGEWKDRPIDIFSVPITDPNGNPLGITNYLRLRLFGGRPGMRRSIHQIDTTGPGLEHHMLTNIVRTIGEDPAAIGFSGFAFETKAVHRLAIAETDAGPYFVGTPDQVADRSYPLTRTIYIALNREPDRPLQPVLRDFLEFVLSPTGQSIVRENGGGYLPLTVAAAQAELRKVR